MSPLKPTLRACTWSVRFLLFAFLFVLASAQSAKAQDILTFDFAALAGNELTATSNFNNAGLSASAISRGAGLTASANAGRFNATSWALTSIANAVAGNNYMEFTITPSAGQRFTVTTIVVQWQRSGTGNVQIALRNSLDGYASDIDGVKNVLDNTSTQTFTWTANQSAQNAPVTYRFYSFAEGSTGSGGPGDGVGNDIVVTGIVEPDNPDSPSISSFLPAAAATGVSVAINGSKFTGATAVAFGGAPATSFSVASDSLINAVVPAGAVAGRITVTTSNGTGTSSTDFIPLDGSGTVGLQNGGLGPFSGKNLFGRSLSGQTVRLVYAPPAAGTVEGLRVTVPAEFGTPLLANVSVTGTGSAGAVVGVTGQTVTITGVSASSPNPISLGISGLSTPDTSTPITNTGRYAFSVDSRGSGGTFAAIAAQPSASVLIPLANARNADPTTFVPALLNQIVAVEGVCLVGRLGTGSTSTMLQDGSLGIALYSLSAVAGPQTRGNRYAAVGTVTQFNGLVQLVLSDPSLVVDLGAGTEPAPTTVSVTQFNADGVSYQSRVIRIENLSFVSGTWAVGQNVILQDPSANQVTIRIQQNSTATTAPAYPVTITGIAGQFDNASPFNSGFQLQPRDPADLNSAILPSISVTPSSISNLTATQGGFGPSTNFTASASNLSNNITVSANDAVNFAISTNNSDFTNTLTLLTNASGGLSNTPVYVRLTGAAPFGLKSNTVSLVSGSVSTNVSVSGTVIDPAAPNIVADPIALSNFTTLRGTFSKNQLVTITGTSLGGSNISVVSSSNFYEISTNSFATAGSNTLTLASTGGVVAVRISTNAPATNSLVGNLALSGGGATNNVALSGVVTNPPAVITVSTNSLPAFSSTTNVASAARSFTAGGSALTANITVAAPTGFQVAFTSNNADFGASVTLTNSEGTATNREVFVRMSSSPTTNNLTARSVTLTTAGGSNQVSVSGTITAAAPALTADPASLTNFFAVAGAPSAVTNYSLRGSNLTTNVSVSAPLGFQVALTNTNSAFTNTLSITNNGSISNSIWVRVSANASTNANLTGNITNAASALVTNVALQARVVPSPTLSAVSTALSNFTTITGIASTNQSFNLSATNLLGPVNLSVTNGYEISLSTNSGFATNLIVALTNASDNAANYTTSPTWTNGANAGTGFGPWSLSSSGGTGGSGGAFVGNPSAGGIGGMNSNSFGLFANPTNSASFANAERALSNALAVGQTLTFQWGINFDSGSGGNKGFNLLVGTNEIVNVDNGGSATITFNGSDVGFGYGTNVMTWSFVRTASNALSITANDRDGVGTYTTNIIVTSAAIDTVKFYASALQAGDSAQPYFNNFQVAYATANISNLPVHVRIGTNAPVSEASNSLVSRVTVSSASASDVFVNLIGSVASNPVITQSNSLVQFSAVQGFPSDPQTFAVGGINLLTNVSVTPPTGYEVSLDGVAWGAFTNVPALPKVGVTTPQTNVFIRVARTAQIGTTNGSIELSSTQASNVLVPVSRVVGANTGPQLVATPTVLPAFATDLGTASASNGFILTGSGLSNSVTLVAPAGFEISTNNGTTFVSNSTLTPRDSGFLSNNIAVRLAGSPTAGIFTGNVSAASVGAVPAVVSVAGTVYDDASAQISATPLLLSNFVTTNGTPSPSQSFLGSARNLMTDLVAMASGGYEVSTNNVDFFPAVSVAPAGGNVAPVAFHARISSNASPTNLIIGAVTLSNAASASNVVVDLRGRVDRPRPLSVVLTAPTNSPTTIAPGSTVRLSAIVSDTNTSGQPVQVATFEFRTNNVAIPGAFVTNVTSPYTLTFDWTPSPAGLPAQVSAWAVDVDGWQGSSGVVSVRNPDPGQPIVGFVPPVAFPTNSQIEAVAPATNGAFYVGGSFTNFVRTVGSVAVTNAATRVARILADGTVDPEFITEIGPNNTVRTLLYSTTNQGLYIGGVFTNVSGVARPGLARLAVGQTNTDDGTLDANFSPTLGGVSAPIVNAIVQQHDGKVLVGGIFATAGAGTNAAGSANLARFLANGLRDVSFNPPAPDGEVKSIALQPDGKILIAGSFARVGGQDRRGLARINGDGTLDTTFTVGTGPNGGFNDTVWSVAVALDGSICAGGQFSSYNGRSVYNRLAMLSASGVLQTRFNFAAALSGGINNSVRNVQIRPGGDILVSGLFTQIANSILFPTPQVVGRVAEFLPDGSLDPTFNPGGVGANNSVLNAATLADGNLVLVGAFSTFNGQPHARMAVLTGSPAADPVVTSPPFVTVDAGSDFDFALTHAAGNAFADPAAVLPRGMKFDPATGKLSGIPLDAGVYDLQLAAVLPGGATGTPSTFRLQVLPNAVPYDTWKRVWFGVSEQTNATVSGRWVTGRNPSGQPNFAVYALSGGDPRAEGTDILPQAAPTYVEGQQYLGYTFWRYPLAQAAYIVETSDDLRIWAPDTVVITNTTDYMQVRPLSPMSLTNRQFLRLRVSEP